MEPFRDDENCMESADLFFFFHTFRLPRDGCLFSSATCLNGWASPLSFSGCHGRMRRRRGASPLLTSHLAEMGLEKVRIIIKTCPCGFSFLLFFSFFSLLMRGSCVDVTTGLRSDDACSITDEELQTRRNKYTPLFIYRKAKGWTQEDAACKGIRCCQRRER